MLTKPMDILEMFPVRKTKQQKQRFRDDLCSYISSLDYEVQVESGKWGCRNVVVGDPETAKYLLTAHYDTPSRSPYPNACAPCSRGHRMLMAMPVILCAYLFGIAAGIITAILTSSKIVTFGVIFGVICLFIGIAIMLIRMGPANPNNVNDNSSGVITLLEIMRSMPENQRAKVCFVFFDLEEAGLVGSSSYRKKHKDATSRQLILNLDCVGDGDQLMMIPTKKLRNDRKKLTSLYKACGYFGTKSLTVCEKKTAVLMSDHMRFPYGVGIAAFEEHKRFGPYFTRIHTPKDTILEETNVNILRAALTSFICRDAAQ